MRNLLSVFIAVLAWFAVAAQYYLLIQNRTTDIAEATLRFFSFFTILTNTLVAIFFTVRVLKPPENAATSRPGISTAVTVYILIVGLVYQFLLRHIWQPQGFQMVVDELLHSVIPLLVVIYWLVYDRRTALTYRHIPFWLIYPLFYLSFVLVRGHFSGFYPYPFLNIPEIGAAKVAFNCVGLTVFFIVVSVIFVGITRWSAKTF